MTIFTSCRLRDLCPDVSRLGFPRRCVLQDVDTSDTEALTVPWRSLGLGVAPKRFICTDAVNDEKIIVCYTCGITSRSLFAMPVCVRNVHHLYQFPDCLVAFTLAIPSVVSRMLLVKISTM